MAVSAAQVHREISLGLKNLAANGLRSLLTMLGMVFGVGSVVAMLAVGEGASQEALERIRQLGSTNIMIHSMQPAAQQNQNQSRIFMSVYGLKDDDLRRLRESLPALRHLVPVKILRKDARVGDQAIEVRVVGTTPQWFELVRRPLLAGRILMDQDLDRHANVVVLGEQAARRLLAGQSPLGAQIRIGPSSFIVVGIVASPAGVSAAMQLPDRENDAYIPLSTAREHFGDVEVRRTAGVRSRELVELHQIILAVDDTARVEPAAEAVASMLSRFHGQKDYDLQVPLTLLKQAEATKRTFNIVLGAIAAISLLVGGIGIMNIMLASVTERTREIGIRRAIGARRSQIMSQFLIETMVLSTSGGLLGLALGLFIPWIISRTAGIPTIVTGTSLVLALGISMTVGIIFGLYPAQRAAGLDPIVALRYE